MLTPEREAELRKLCSTEMRDAFAEIDRLREEVKLYSDIKITFERWERFWQQVQDDRLKFRGEK